MNEQYQASQKLVNYVLVSDDGASDEKLVDMYNFLVDFLEHCEDEDEFVFIRAHSGLRLDEIEDLLHRIDKVRVLSMEWDQFSYVVSDYEEKIKELPLSLDLALGSVRRSLEEFLEVEWIKAVRVFKYLAPEGTVFTKDSDNNWSFVVNDESIRELFKKYKGTIGEDYLSADLKMSYLEIDEALEDIEDSNSIFILESLLKDLKLLIEED